MKRRDFVAGAVASMAVAKMAQAQPTTKVEKNAEKYHFEKVVQMAQELSKNTDRVEKLFLSGTPFADLTYDQHRAIRFKREKDPFLKLQSNFALDLLPPGRFYQDRVHIFLVERDVEKPIAFDMDYFDFDSKIFSPEQIKLNDEQKKGVGFSGFRLRFPINKLDVKDEFVVFQGASYFRAVAKNTLYGLSARGLSINTGTPEGEEFPRFTHFWIHEPKSGDRSIRIDALLQSASITGAFSFEILPGGDTVFMVRSVFFARREIKNYGIAPLTSMFYFNSNNRARIDDYRNAVHDSDGLLMYTGKNNLLLRALSNPTHLQFSAFMDDNPKGFGLVQRARQFEDFQDIEAQYEKRPSLWVEPQGDWGKGSVSLVELPVNNEFNDNIVAFWNGEKPLKAGERAEFRYHLFWSEEAPIVLERAKVIASRSGKSVNHDNCKTFVLDFQLSDAQAMIPPDQLKLNITATRGKVLSSYLTMIPQTKILRVGFEYLPENNALAELQASVSHQEQLISEMWLYRWVP